MNNRTDTIRIAHVLRRLDPELTAHNAVHIARHVYSPVRRPSLRSDPRLYLSGRVDRLPDHHSWYSLGEIMWRVLRILDRAQQIK